jgi:hypothetical protein
MNPFARNENLPDLEYELVAEGDQGGEAGGRKHLSVIKVT